MFTNRETILTLSGQLNGNNSAATVEPGEPNHGGKPGGHSLWISWVAPTNGVARFKTEGSGFDTLLAAYYFASTNDTTFDKLLVAARADDSEGFESESEIEFGVIMGQRYEIAVDGYYAATGPVELQWTVDGTAGIPPIVLSTPADRALKVGDAVTLTVVLTNDAGAQLKWFFNDNELGITTATLSIASMQVTNVGRYKLQIKSGSVSYFAAPVELQINTEGATNVLAQNKLLDSRTSELVGGDGNNGPNFSRLNSGPRPLVTVIRGYSGSQIFNTTFAVTDPNEPPHCGVVSGASYWLAYTPPTNGTITLDTIGSTYDTVLEAYTYNVTPTNYANLISLACDNDSVAPQGAARVFIPVIKGRQYVMVVAGVNGARGTAYLNYSLDTNSQPTAPKLLSPPVTQVAASGSAVTLAANWTGSAPVQCSWQKDQTPLPGASAPGLLLTNLSTADTANYVLSVTNDLGSLTVTLPLRVVTPPLSALTPTTSGFRLSWLTVSGQVYTIEEANAVVGPWQRWTNAFLGDGQTSNVDLAPSGTRFYRILVQ
jgi:hypothetical protein